MRYSHEYKLECIELYRKGIWPETPEGIKTSNFHLMVRYLARIEEQNGPDALKHLGNNKVWTPEAKYELVAKVLAGQSNKSVAVSAGINNGMLYTWVRKYKELGYNGLVNKKKGRKSKNPDMKKKGTIYQFTLTTICSVFVNTTKATSKQKSPFYIY